MTKDFGGGSEPKALPPNYLLYRGTWTIDPASATAGPGAAIDVRFKAEEVFLVMGSESGPKDVRVLLDGKPIGGLGDAESVWHADMTYNDNPPKAACLFAVEIPPSGGNTYFANMYLAYETLPPDLKERVGQLRCVHDASRNSAGSSAMIDSL